MVKPDHFVIYMQSGGRDFLLLIQRRRQPMWYNSDSEQPEHTILAGWIQALADCDYYSTFLDLYNGNGK